MCEPATIAYAVAAASAVYGAYTTNENAQSQEKYQRKQIAAREEQIYFKKSAEGDARMRAARAERAKLRAQSAESGVSGVSITDLLNNVDMQAGMDLAHIEGNTGLALEANQLEGQSRLNSITQADYGATALSVAGSAADGYGAYQDYRINQGGT